MTSTTPTATIQYEFDFPALGSILAIVNSFHAAAALPFERILIPAPFSAEIQANDANQTFDIYIKSNTGIKLSLNQSNLRVSGLSDEVLLDDLHTYLLAMFPSSNS